MLYYFSAQETENVKQKNSVVDNSEKGKSHDSRYASGQRDGQYRSEQPHRQRHEKLTISTGNKVEKSENQSIRDNYRKTQGEKQRHYEQRDQLRNNKEVNKQRNKESGQCQNQFRNQQKHDDKIPLEKSFHNQNNKQEQCPEKNDYNRDNGRNDTQPSAARKQPEVKRENQSSRTGRNRDSSDQQSSHMDGSYKKNYTKYDQTDHKKLDGADKTQKSARSEYNAPNYRNRREKQGRVGEAGEVRQSTESYRERTGTCGQNPRQSENQKENRHSGKTQYKENKDASNREKEGADKRTDKVTTKNAREDIKQTPKNKVGFSKVVDITVYIVYS